MKRIERDPEPWQYSENGFQHLVESMRRAEAQERDSKQRINWSAFKASFLGMTISIAFWWVFIYTVIWAVERVQR